MLISATIYGYPTLIHVSLSHTHIHTHRGVHLMMKRAIIYGYPILVHVSLSHTHTHTQGRALDDDKGDNIWVSYSL